MQRQSAYALLLLWHVAAAAAVEHALFIRVPRQEPLGIFGEEGYNIPLPSGPPLLEEQRDKREAQGDSLPLQNVFRWFQEQFPNQNRRKAARDISETLGDPSRQYLPVNPPSSQSSSTPRPFQPSSPTFPGSSGPSFPGSLRPSPPSFPGSSRPSPPSFPGSSGPSIPGSSRPSPPSFPGSSGPSIPGSSRPSPPSFPGSSGPSFPGSSRPSPPSFPGSSRPSPPSSPGSSRPPSLFPGSSLPSPFPSEAPPSFPSSPSPSLGSSSSSSSLDDAHLHPPHIHALDVTCAKDQMDIRIEFDREFDGTIYSKGHYTDAACRHVTAGSGQTVYQFTLYLNQCGTRFVDAFATTEGRAYLEGTLVLQNEPGIQEVWDTVRNVQCLWEGNIKQKLKTGVSVDMLDEQVVTFSGDTASTQLDVRVGKFGEGGGGASATAGGLVQIGTDMSLVVTIDGDPGFDVHVRECIAKPAGGVSEAFEGTPERDYLQLTDERGCPLKTKIFGAFQKKRGGVGIGGQDSTLYAYAHFQAFKFPDRNDVTIECDVELCKSGCDFCPNIEQNTVGFSVRRKRETNSTYNKDGRLQDMIESVRMVQHMRVVTPEELSLLSGAGSSLIGEGQAVAAEPGVCMSHWGFATASILLLSALTAACVLSVALYIRSWKNPPHILKAQTLAAYIPNTMSHR